MKQDWNPDNYDIFARQRLQPALDLLHGVGALPEGDIVDLGCGSGAAAAALKARFPERRLLGVDNSPAMLVKALETGRYDAVVEADIAEWTPADKPALVFSNAALQWLGDHETLLQRLCAECLAPGGCLAVQMPHQNEAPSHRAWREAFAQLFPGRTVARGPEVHDPDWYHRLLAPVGQVRVWETDYYQTLQPTVQGHPVRRFTETTFGKPFLDACQKEEQASLVAAYEELLKQPYPVAADGSVLFPFKRLFFIYGV